MAEVVQIRRDAKTAMRLIELAQEQDLEVIISLYNGQVFEGKVKDIIRENGSLLLYKERPVFALNDKERIQTVYHNILWDAISSVSVYDLEEETEAVGD